MRDIIYGYARRRKRPAIAVVSQFEYFGIMITLGEYDMLKHPHAKNVYTEIEASTGNNVEIVLVVMTDLELDGLSPSYDKTKVDSLLIAVQDFMNISQLATKASIRTIR